MKKSMDMEPTKWTNLLAMAVVSILAMYVLMYVMVNSISNAYTNLNQFYMAGLMTGAMMLIEMALMRSMYAKKVVIPM
jgi:hypothetical protein